MGWQAEVGRGSEEGFAVSAAPAMQASVEILPLELDGGVAFELEVAFGISVSVADVVGEEVGEQEGVDAFVLVFGADGDEHEIDDVVVGFEGAEDVEPSGREEASAAGAEGFAEGGEGDSDTDEGVVFVNNDADAVGAEDGEVFSDVVFDLAVGEGGVAVEVVVGSVDEVEEGFAVLVLEAGDGFVSEAAEVVFPADDFGDAEVFVGDFVGDGHFVFDPVDVFGVTPALHVSGVVGVVVDCGHSAHFVEAVDEHALVVHVGESHRADHLGHAFGASPGFGGVHQGVVDFGDVDEVDGGEAGFFFSGAFVDLVVDDDGDFADGLTIDTSHEQFGLAEFVCRVFVGHEIVDLIEDERGYEAGVVVVDVDSESDEFSDGAACLGNGCYLDVHSKEVVVLN